MCAQFEGIWEGKGSEVLAEVGEPGLPLKPTRKAPRHTPRGRPLGPHRWLPGQGKEKLKVVSLNC